MRYKLLGKSGLKVSEICLGTMTFGEEWGWGAAQGESKKIFDAFVKAGGNFIDTANRYTNGTSEKYVGEFIRSDRQRFVLATKYTFAAAGSDPNAGGNHRKNMMQSVGASLKRLKTDYIDVYWVHGRDDMTPVDEIMRGLDDLVHQGKVLYVGISNTPAWEVARANTLAELKGWSSFVGLQVEYNLLERTPERELLPMSRALEIGVTAWAPLAGGALTGKYLETNDQPKRLAEHSVRLNERNTAIAREVRAVANDIGCTSAQVALNWVRAQRGTVIPIVGARNEPQVADSLGALAVELPIEYVERLNEVSRIDMGFPHEFLARPNIQEITFGGMRDRIDFEAP